MALVPEECPGVRRELLAAGKKVGLTGDFCPVEKVSGIAPGMILLWARGLELKVRLVIA